MNSSSIEPGPLRPPADDAVLAGVVAGQRVIGAAELLDQAREVQRAEPDVDLRVRQHRRAEARDAERAARAAGRSPARSASGPRRSPTTGPSRRTWTPARSARRSMYGSRLRWRRVLPDPVPVGQREDDLQDLRRQLLSRGGQVLRIGAPHQRDRAAQLALAVVHPGDRRVDRRSTVPTPAARTAARSARRRTGRPRAAAGSAARSGSADAVAATAPAWRFAGTASTRGRRLAAPAARSASRP